MSSLLDLRFIVLSGKGGVGRTTVAAALARAAADAGRRVLIAQATASERLPRMFGTATGAAGAAALARRDPETTGAIVTLAPGIDAVNMTPQSALHEYGLMVLRSELVTRALFDNRAVRGFLNAIPGLDAYSMLGKAWWHTTETTAAGRPRYDLVILDGPASGHATLMLRIPQAILDAMPKGPLSRDARAIRDLLSDPARAALLIVTLAEDLPARETAELASAARTSLRVPLGPVIVNALPPAELSDAAVAAVLDRLPPSRFTGDGPLDTTLHLAASVRTHRRIAEDVLQRLRADPALAGCPLITLPRLPTAAIGPAELAALGATLSRALADVVSRPR